MSGQTVKHFASGTYAPSVLNVANQNSICDGVCNITSQLTLTVPNATIHGFTWNRVCGAAAVFLQGDNYVFENNTILDTQQCGSSDADAIDFFHNGIIRDNVIVLHRPSDVNTSNPPHQDCFQTWDDAFRGIAHDVEIYGNTCQNSDFISLGAGGHMVMIEGAWSNINIHDNLAVVYRCAHTQDGDNLQFTNNTCISAGLSVGGSSTLGFYSAGNTNVTFSRNILVDFYAPVIVTGNSIGGDSNLVYCGTPCRSDSAWPHANQLWDVDPQLDANYCPSAQYASYGKPCTLEPPPSPTFEDVGFTHPYHDDIEALYQAGYTAGCSTDPLLYCPEQTMNRAESSVFVERGIHTATYSPPTPTSQAFADLPLDSWAASWVNGLWADGYTAGCGTNPLIYCPWQGHTRAEGCVFYMRMLHGANFTPPVPSQQVFADVPLDTWFASWVHAAYQAGLIEPCQTAPELHLCPNDGLTRAVSAHMMVKAKQLR